MLRKKRIKKNLKKIYSEEDLRYKKVNNFISSHRQCKAFNRIFELMFEDYLIEGWPVEYTSIQELIKRYSSCLTNEQLQQLKDLGYGKYTR